LAPIRKSAAWCVGAVCGVAILTAFWLTRPVEPEHVTGARVLRIIADERTEELPVFQVAFNGTVSRFDADRPKTGRIPTLRIELQVEGHPVTLWVWDCPKPRDR
jgi:hypothetical protein